MKKIIVLLFTFISTLTYSQHYVRDYTYNASENDSKVDAKQYALLEVKKNLIEELGVLVISQTNLNITQDNITLNTNSRTISECITQTKIMDESWDGEFYYIKVKIFVDKNRLIRRLKKLSKEIEIDNQTPIFRKKEEKEDISFYSSIDVYLQQLNDDNYEDKNSIMVGLTLGALFNGNILLGIYGNVNSENKYNEITSKNLRYSNGGIIFGLRLFKKSPVRLFIPVRLGMGSIKYYDNEWTIIEEDNDNFYVINYGLGLEIKLTKILNLGIDCNYKLTDDIKLSNTPNNILNGCNINLSLKMNVK